MAGPRVNRGAVFQALTGRAGVDVSGRGDDIRGMLAAVGGESDRTRSGIDLTAAARKLGVHRSTVARWLSRAEGGPGSVPSGDHMKSLRKRARQAATTQAGRRAAMRGVRAQIAAQPRTMVITGYQGIARAGKQYPRSTSTAVDLSPDQLEAMVDAYEQGGDRGFAQWANTVWGGDDESYGEYVSGWTFLEIDAVDLEGR